MRCRWGTRGRPRAAAIMAAAGLLAGCSGGHAGTNATGTVVAKAECPGIAAPDGSRGRELRGMWIATVTGMDWPSGAGRSAARQQARFRRLLDTAKALGLNAVFVQIRPTADAFYPSPYEPWSQWISGRQGKDPGYDVLGFMLAEAHRRDLEFHAWFNPYRVSRQPHLTTLHPSNPARRNPGWVRRYTGGLWYDPGLPQVRDLVSKVVLDVVRKYDIDGVHFDDYFYPYPGPEDFPDQAAYQKYGAGFTRAAWRRHNVDALIQQVSSQVRQAKPWVRFGISPFGVWRNRSTDPAGSATHALQSYDDIYADSRLWVRKGWVDYITPQLYWPIGDKRADYRRLVTWWSRQVRGTGVQLTIGHGAYRVGEPGPWREPAELSRQLDVSDKLPEVQGHVFFSARDLAGDRLGFAALLAKDHYFRPAIIPVAGGSPTRPGPAAHRGAPALVWGARSVAGGRSVTVRWQGSGATSYAVYRVEGRARPCAPVDPGTLFTTVRGSAIVDPTVKPETTYTYYVTALERAHRESVPGRGTTITTPHG